MFTIYHNPRCKKSRAGLEYLQTKTNDFTIIDYIKNQLTVNELETLLTKLNRKPLEIIRTQEDFFKKELKGKKFTDPEWVRIMVENPKLIKRPIIVKDNKAVWGDPAETIDQLF
jgi:arsenate reductase